MTTWTSNAEKAVKEFLISYLVDKDVEHVLRLISDDILWFGVSNFDVVRGKQELCSWMQTMIQKESGAAYQLQFGSFRLVAGSPSLAAVCGELTVRLGKADEKSLEFHLRFTSLITNREGQCLITHMHLSVPSAKDVLGTSAPKLSQLESQTLQLLNSSIAGGMMGGYLEKGFPLYFINAPMLQYLGYTYPQFIEDTKGLISNCIHPDDREHVEESVNHSLKHGDEYEINYRMRKRDGSYIWVWDKGRRCLSEDGRQVIISVCIDITQSVRLQQELEEKSDILTKKNAELEHGRNRLQFILDNVAGGLAEFSAENSKLLYISDSLFTLIGYTPEEFYASGKTFASIHHPDDRKRIQTELHRQLEAGGSLHLDYRIVKKDGSVSWIQMDANRFDAGDGTQHIVAVYNDITALKNSQAELSSLTNAIPGGVIKVSLEKKKIVYANRYFYEMSGYPKKEYEKLLRTKPLSCIHPKDRQLLSDTMNCARETENEEISIEYRFLTPAKQWVWRLLSGRIYRDDDGGLMALCVVIDNTERKTLELSLRMEKEQYRIVTELSGSTLWNYDIAAGKMPELGLEEVAKEDASRLKGFFNRCRLGGGDLSLEFRARRKGGKMSWFRIEAALLRDTHDHVIRAIGKLTDIEEEKKNTLELRRATQLDGMTGLFNKTHMHGAVDEILEKHKTLRTAAFFIIDVDNFKQVNDHLGHLFGDTVLTSIAQSIQALLPPDAIAGRVGGDEFVILLVNRDKKYTAGIADAIRQKICEVYAGELESTKISCSIGISLFPEQGKNYLTLFHNADEALYHAKKSGKNQAVFYDRRRMTESGDGAFYNDYLMDEQASVPSVSRCRLDTQDFFGWVTRLLSSTKDLTSAIQLVLDRVCNDYHIDYIFIIEYLSMEQQAQVTYLRCLNHTIHPIIRRYDSFPYSSARLQEDFQAMYRRGAATQQDILNVLPDSLSRLREPLRKTSVLQFGMYNGERYIGSLTAAMEQREYLWSTQEQDLLHQLTALLTPHLLQKHIADESAYQVDRALHYDSLTSLPLLSHFKTEAQRILNENPSLTYAVICSDIHNFKYVNDTYGFAAGDEVLCIYADVLKNGNQKQNLCAARITNDKFTAMVPFESFETLKEHIRETHEEIRQRVQKRLAGVTLFMNTGVCVIQREENGVMKAIDNANLARKREKGKAKDTCRLYDGELEQQLALENNMSSHMHAALEQGEFEVYLQPKVLTHDSSLVGAEALIRWNRPTGMIYPNDFIPCFEKNGFITKIDEFVLVKVLETLHRWIGQYGKAIPISLNLSRLHGDNPNKVQEIIDLTTKYQVPSSCIEFELTETALYDDATRLKQLMEKLIDNGYSVSIDDFGSGYSSLNAIANIPANIIKLDKGFLMKEGEKAYNRIVVKHIIAMAKEMGFSIICEGVETEKQVAFLKAMDCDMAQGYFFAKPMPIAEFEKKYFGTLEPKPKNTEDPR